MARKIAEILKIPIILFPYCGIILKILRYAGRQGVMAMRCSSSFVNVAV
jgi:phosphotransferase system  glucose/maltose/N-acetylglucosamine-specific IIC component